LFFNPTPIVGDSTSLVALTQGLAENEADFNINFSNHWDNDMTQNDFAEQIVNFGTQPKKSSVPNVYGSYFIYEADQAEKQYKFISYVNTTSQDAPGLFPAFMY
jgi:hypothetical protein